MNILCWDPEFLFWGMFIYGSITMVCTFHFARGLKWVKPVLFGSLLCFAAGILLNPGAAVVLKMDGLLNHWDRAVTQAFHDGDLSQTDFVAWKTNYMDQSVYEVGLELLRSAHNDYHYHGQ